MPKVVAIFNETVGTHMMCLHEPLADQTYAVMHLDLSGQIHHEGYDDWNMYIIDETSVDSKNQIVFSLVMNPREANLVLRHDSDPTNPTGAARAWAINTGISIPAPLTYNEDAGTITTGSGTNLLYLSTNRSDPYDKYVYFTKTSPDRWKIEYLRP
ncbi:hypothetical protein JAU75_10445 [Ochrobactrum sp. Q0168]|uniref:hypothetical protein n=1 Tax=Ochrobactrum sp. Q0168 TaxID=2793241 RepID=UPI0018ED2311|nr:hypothetical protein [Ochrobactrum sp. Q0168]